MTEIRDDEHFADVCNKIVNILLPELLNKLMEWKKPEELPPHIATMISRITAVTWHLNEYIEESVGDNDEPPDLLN